MRETIENWAEEEMSGAARLRMFCTAMVTATWIAVMMLVLHEVGGATGAEVAVVSTTFSMALFGMHVVFSRLPAIASLIQSHWYGGETP